MKNIPITLLLTGLLSSTLAQASQVIALPIVTQGPITRCLENGQPPKLHFTLVYKDTYSTCYQDNTQIVAGAFIDMRTAQQIAKA